MDPLDELFAQLRGASVIRIIYERIDEARRHFKTGLLELKSYRDFNQHIAEFIQHLYSHGLLVPRMISLRAAMAEGLDLLERQYEGNGGIQGYDAAYLDAVSSQGRGFDFVLSQLAESIRDREIFRYTNGQFSLLIDPSDWNIHKRIVGEIVEKYAAFLPDDICNGSPDRFINYYRDLIEVILSSDQTIEQVRNSPKISLGN
ncbi:MAG: hypothetical protein NT002_00170 [candidate division Zixibacteria bacterium]|nr:hypothetical protein [candidate division Zixibacteria bacterium]